MQRGRTRARVATKTRVATKRRNKKYYVVDDRAGSITYFSANYKSTIPRTTYKQLASLEPFMVNEVNSSILTSLVGKHDITDTSIFEQNKLATMVSQAWTAMGITGTPGSATMDIYLMGATMEQRYSNMTNGLLEFDLYDWVARRDIYQNHTGGVSTPQQCWAQGIADQTTTGSSGDYKTLSITPFASKLFTMNYKVVKSRHVVLAPGQQHIHKVAIYPKKRINYELISNANIYGMKGLYRGTSIVYHGGVVKAGSNDDVTVSNAEIGYLTNIQYKYKVISNNFRREYVTVNTLQTTVSTTAALDVLPTGAIDTFRSV